MTGMWPIHRKALWKGFTIVYLWMVYVGCISHTEALSRHSRSGGTLPGNWTITPGNIKVMAQTAARFDWQHDIASRVQTVWDYLGASKIPLMEYIGDEVQFMTPTKSVRYLDGKGSAVMILENVTSADAGTYLVKVIDLDSRDQWGSNYHIVDKSMLSVVHGSDLNMTVFFNGAVFKISMIENGTYVFLPGDELRIPIDLNVEMRMNPSAPKPTGHSIRGLVDQETFIDHSCDSGYICKRKLHFGSAVSGNTAVNVSIVVRFDVQNLEPIRITRTYLIAGGSSPKEAPADIVTTESPTNNLGMQVGLPVSLSLIGVIIMVVAMVLYKHRKKTSKNQYAKELLNPNPPISVDDLNEHVIETDLAVAEYMFKFDFIPFEKSMKTDRNILASLMALLNTSGGVIVLAKVGDHSITVPEFETWQNKFERCLTNFLRFFSVTSIKKCVRLVHVESPPRTINIMVGITPNIVLQIEPVYMLTTEDGQFKHIKDYNEIDNILAEKTSSGAAQTEMTIAPEIMALLAKHHVEGAFLERRRYFVINDNGNITHVELTDAQAPLEGLTPNNIDTATMQKATSITLEYQDALRYSWSDANAWRNDFSQTRSSNCNIPTEVKFPMFDASNPLRCTPNLEFIKEILNEHGHPNWDRLQSLCESGNGWLLACQSIVSAFNNNASIKVPDELIMDILFFSKDEGLFLMPVSSNAETSILLKYGSSAARTLKKYLIREMKRDNTGDCPDVFHIGVACIHANYQDDETKESALPDKPFTWSNKIDDELLRRALVAVLMTQRTYVRNILSEYMMLHKMSDKQREIKGCSGHVMIEGPPGAGKSWVIKEFCKEASRSLLIHFCITEGRHKRWEGISQVCCVHSQTQLEDISQFSEEWDIVILDVDQLCFVEQKAAYWKGILNKINCRRLVICQDTISQTGSGLTNTDDLKAAFNEYCDRRSQISSNKKTLSKVHRTSSKIASFLKAGWPAEKPSTKTDVMEECTGDDVMLHVLPLNEPTELIDYTVELTRFLIVGTRSLKKPFIYCPTDITVVVDTKIMGRERAEQIQQEIRKRFGTPSLDGAKCITSVSEINVELKDDCDRLETKAVIFVIIGDNNCTKPWKPEDITYITGMASRATRRVDFVYQGPGGEQLKQLLGFHD